MENEKIDDKADHEHEEEEEETEEMKIEKFYSLIRSYHDARNRLRLRKSQPQPLQPQPPPNDDETTTILDLENNNNNKRRKKMDDNEEERRGGGAAAGNWVPCFKLEDFGAKEVEFQGGSPFLIFSAAATSKTTAATSSGTSTNINAEQKQDDGSGSILDLKLTL